jgi:hypothetical protein
MFATFYHTPLSIWGLTYFFLVLYVFLIFIAALYLVSNMKDFTNFSAFKNSTFFQFVSGLDMSLFFSAPLIALIIVNAT